MKVARFGREAPNPRPDNEAAPAPLRVLLVDDGAHRVALIRDELTRQGHEVVGVIDSALVIHECVTRLRPDVVIVDSESPSRDTLEHMATLSGSNPRPVVVFAEDDSDEPHATGDARRRQRLRGRRPAAEAAGLGAEGGDRALRAGTVAARAARQARRRSCRRGAAVERAKGILMQQGGLSEDAAHEQLRKLAMDRGREAGAAGREDHRSARAAASVRLNAPVLRRTNPRRARARMVRAADPHPVAKRLARLVHDVLEAPAATAWLVQRFGQRRPTCSRAVHLRGCSRDAFFHWFSRSRSMFTREGLMSDERRQFIKGSAALAAGAAVQPGRLGRRAPTRPRRRRCASASSR